MLAALFFIMAGFSSVVADNYLLPKLSAVKFFSGLEFFQRAGENMTVIERTEKVIIKEEDSINEIASQAATAVVNIISISETEKRSQNGTGVIVTSDGLVATYRDAILEGKVKYKVLIFNGKSYDASFLGADNLTNLAFLKVGASNLPVISFANSDDFRPGKKLIAIGNSFGEYQNRFASGLLSNIDKTFNLSGKTVSSSEKWEGVLETDFNNQAEYVGGPVINYNGELAGITGAVVLNNKEKYFQIPSNVVKKSMELAIENKLENRPVLGIYYLSVTKVLAAANDTTRDRGALVYSASGNQGLAVISGSPAEKAGLKINDIIIAVDGQEINLDNPLSVALGRHSKGEKTELLVDRKGKEITLKVQL